MPYKREKFELENGLKVLIDHRESSKAMAITCMVGAGSIHDPLKKPG